MGNTYLVMCEVLHLLNFKFKDKYPELIVELEKLWNRSYTDITGVGFFLDPLVMRIRKVRKHSMHDALVGSIAEHETAVEEEIVEKLDCRRAELNLFLNNGKNLTETRTTLLMHPIIRENQKVIIINVAIS